MPTSLQKIYDALFACFGPQNWWPAETEFEVIVGAILTQNTNWTNVEKAIDNLRSANALDLDTINKLPLNELETLIYPSGFFRQKAARLQNFTRFIVDEFNGELTNLFTLPDEELRKTLLNQPGIGPETADSIILYAAQRPSFVVDAYTLRILGRIGLLKQNSGYDQTRNLFMETLPRETRLFNEYHALLVRLAKVYCRKKNPVCNNCPVVACCNYGQNADKD